MLNEVRLSSASQRISYDRQQSAIETHIVEKIADFAVQCSAFAALGGGDLCKRHGEALGNTILAFHSPGLVARVRKQAKLLGEESVMSVEWCLERVEAVRQGSNKDM